MTSLSRSSRSEFSADPRVERSLRHSVRDGVAHSVMSGTGDTYFAAYALFLGATAAQVSLLAALPPLFGALTQLLGAWLEARVGRRRTLMLTGALMHALTWFPIIWLPYLFPAHAVPAMVSCVVLYYGWTGLSAPLWSSLMGELVPARKRGRFFGDRTQRMSVSGFLALIVAGLTLQYLELRDNAQLAFILIFSAAALARLCSVYHLARMHEPAAPQAIAAPAPSVPRTRFAHFSVFIAATRFAVSVAGPFFAIYMLKDLGFSYLEFALATAAAVVLQFLSLPAWGRLADLYGNRALVSVTGLLLPLVPVLWLCSSAFAWVLFVQALAGWVWAGFGLAAGNLLYDVTPAERRASYFAVHNLLNTVGACVGALLGSLLSTKLPHSIELLGHTLQWKSGLWGVLLISALLRALVQLTFVGRLAEPRPRRAFSARRLAVGMLRFNFVMDFIARRLRARRCAKRLSAPNARFRA